MTRLTIFKLTFALGGLILFFASIRTGVQALKWAGIACVAMAFMSRFTKLRALLAGMIGEAHDPTSIPPAEPPE